MHAPQHPVRFVTAASLFDGHDASINIMRRILQRQGAEVIHLGHNRSVDEVVTAAIQEDVQGVAVSSYQGGHVEYFTYLVELLRERGAGHVRVYGGGGGVIVPAEIALLQRARGRADLLARGRPAPRPARDDQPDDRGVRRRPRRRAGRPSTGCRTGDRRHRRPRADRSPRAAACREVDLHAAAARSRCSASPAPAARASRRSPTSCSGGSASTRRTSCASRCSPSTRPAAAAAARCSATGSG